MISTALAADLRAAGLSWTPVSGDAFQIAGPDFEGDVFTVSDMTIEAHVYPTGTVLGFNGTTEWALDSVALDDALWLPREDQLRDALGGRLVSLTREERAAYVVVMRTADGEARFTSEDPAEAYGLALLALLRDLA
ncbi:MAG TPA: pilus assembly protein CpaE [Pseudolysinimonas sp.]|nr:pilus assembly protein CpaE [Pseudolysinimonas sp.]